MLYVASHISLLEMETWSLILLYYNADISPAGLPPAHDMRNYVSRDEDRHGPQVVKEAKSIASEYDRYLKNSVCRKVLSCACFSVRHDHCANRFFFLCTSIQLFLVEVVCMVRLR